MITSIEIARFVILALGWSILVVGSLFSLRAIYRDRRLVETSPLLRALRAAVIGWIIAMFILGIEATAFMLTDPIGVLMTIPVFFAWLILMWFLVSRLGTVAHLVVEHKRWLRANDKEKAEKAAELSRIVQERTESLRSKVEELNQTKSALLNLMDDLNEEKKGAEEKVIALEQTKIALVNVMEDLKNEREAVTESRSRLASVLDSIVDGICVFDVDFKIRMINPVMESWLGVRGADIEGRACDSVIKCASETGDAVIDSFARLLKESSNEAGKHLGLNLIAKGGRIIPISVAASPVIQDGRINGLVVVLRDVSVERGVDRAKSEFVSIASHQLRTPLTAMNWYVESIMSGDFGELPDQVRQSLNIVLISGRRLANLITALLNVTRIEMKYYRIVSELVSLKEICEGVIGEVRTAADEKRVTLSFKAARLPKVQLDPNLIKIVVQNLVDNAVKYSFEGGSVAIDLSRDGEMAMLRVKDDGMGIPEEQQRSIFQKMFRAENAVQNVPDGTGLGLYIAKAVVEDFGGKIWFESEFGKGATFFVVLPLKGIKPRSGTQTLIPETIRYEGE